MDNVEDQLRDRIKALRENKEDNETLIKEAIKGIYFLLDEDPTQSRVLEFVRVPGKSPSVSTVVKHINIFKQDLRRRLRLKLNMPDIPAETLLKVEEAVSGLLQSCQVVATASLEQERADMRSATEEIRRQCERQLMEANLKVEAKEDHVHQMKAEVETAQKNEANAMQMHSKSLTAIAQLEAQLKEVETSNVSLREERSALAAEIKALRENFELRLTELEAARLKQHEADQREIQKLASLLQDADQRQMNLKVELKREADKVDALQKDVRKERDLATEAAARAANTIRDIQAKATEAITEAAELRGRLQANEDVRNALEEKHARLEREFSTLEGQHIKAQEKTADLEAKLQAANAAAEKNKEKGAKGKTQG